MCPFGFPGFLLRRPRRPAGCSLHSAYALYIKALSFCLLIVWFSKANRDPFKLRFPNMSNYYERPVNLREVVKREYIRGNRTVEWIPQPGAAGDAELVRDDVALENWFENVTGLKPHEVGKLDPSKRPKLALVAVSGGATRSAVWTAVVLDRIEQKIPGFRRHLRIITGASGGMLGAAYFLKRYRDVLKMSLQLLPSVRDESEIPAFGSDLVIIARVGDTGSLHFRIFDTDGKQMNKKRGRTTRPGRGLNKLKEDLDTLWLPPKDCDFRWMSSVDDPSRIPNDGEKRRIILALVDQVLHVRIFDGDGNMVADTNERRLTEHPLQIQEVRRRIIDLPPNYEFDGAETVELREIITSIFERHPLRPHQRHADRIIESVRVILGHFGARPWVDDIPLASIGAVSRFIAMRDTWLAWLPRNQTFFPQDDRGVRLENDWAELRFPIRSLARLEKAGRVPSMILSPMTVEDGRRLLISNLDLWDMTQVRGNALTFDDPGYLEYPYSLSAIEFFRLFPAATSFTLATGVRMSTPFPYVSPAVSLPTVPPRRVVDAGYYDNYGIQIATAWIQKNPHCFTNIRRVWFWSRSATRSARGTRYEVADAPASPVAWLSRGFGFFTSPIDGAASARCASTLFRNDQDVWELSDLFDRKNRFDPTPDENDRGKLDSSVFHYCRL